MITGPMKSFGTPVLRYILFRQSATRITISTIFFQSTRGERGDWLAGEPFCHQSNLSVGSTNAVVALSSFQICFPYDSRFLNHFVSARLKDSVFKNPFFFFLVATVWPEFRP